MRSYIGNYVTRNSCDGAQRTINAWAQRLEIKKNQNKTKQCADGYRLIAPSGPLQYILVL